MLNADKNKIEEVRADIERVARMVVDNPNTLAVIAEVGEQTVVMKLTVSREEIGKVIGKQGKMAEALRTLLNSFASRRGLRSVLSIEE